VRSILALAGADVAATTFLLAVAMWFREVLAPAWFGIDAFSPATSYTTLWPVLLLVAGVRAVTGLYPGHGLSEVAQLRGQTVATGLVAATVLAGGSLFRFDVNYSRVVLVAWFVGLVIVLPLVRAGVRWGLGTRPWFGIKVHVHTRDAARFDVERALAQRPGFGLRPVALSVPADAAVLPMDDVAATAWDTLADRYPRVWVVTSAWFAAMPSTVTEVGGRVALELRARLLEPGNLVLKRALDLILTVIVAPIATIICAAVAVAIVIDGPGPLIVRHQRVGRGGRPVTVLKFRTMVPDAEVRLQALLAADSLLAGEWATYQKLRCDPRVTRVGRILRATSLDELPQIWNVLRGEMSWVGPRPVLLDELERYGSRRELYLKVLPGITGLVQVSGRSDLPYDQRVALDASYVRNWSVWLDLVVLARTFAVVLQRRGAV
jgi:lipopolysaccharide/colanic/teichoic acid biosynthesis glycosyltransferase